MSDPDVVKRAWKESAADAVLPDLANVRAGADQFYRRVRRRNAREYVACVLIVTWFSGCAVYLPSLTMRVGAIMIVLGTLIVAWQLHRVASAAVPPERATAEPILIHQRAQLSRQCEAAASVFYWYLLPLIPGLLVFTLGPALDRGAAGLAHVPIAMWIVLIIAIAAYAGVWLLNQRAAARLRKLICEIDAMLDAKK